MDFNETGVVKAICISPARGTEKHTIPEGHFIPDFGIEGDAHAGTWHRQVSLLSYNKVEEFNKRGANVGDGAFGENLVVDGIDFRALHSHCAIYHRVGECIMPREGVFAEVIKEGIIRPGDVMRVEAPDENRPFTAAVIVLSDKGSRGEREDASGPAAEELLKEAGYDVLERFVIPDEPAVLKHHLIRLADSRQVDLVITSGGTGFSMRDQTPEATLAVADRNAPGIAEYIRMKSMQITDRAMLSRGASVIRKKTLIVNLPGSPKAVKESLGFILGALDHGLKILRGTASECARK